MGLLSTICIVGITQILFLLVLLSLKSKVYNKKITVFFYGLLIVFLVNLIWVLCYEHDLLETFWFLKAVETTIAFLYGPLLLFLVKSQFTNNFKLRSSIALHFIPAAIYFLFNSPLFFRSSTLDYLSQLEIEIPAILSYYNMEDLIFFVFWRIHVIVYIIFIFKYLKELRKYNYFNNNIDKSVMNKRLMANKILIFTYITFSLTGLIDLILNATINVDFQSYYFNFCLLVLHIFILSYIIFLDSNVLLTPIVFFKKKHSNLKNINVKLLNENIEDLMKNQRVYLNRDLTLVEFANLLSVTTHQLSEYFNVKENHSFKDYINKYRINHAKKMLLNSDNEKYTLDGIAYNSGFRSLATFHRNFKKHTNSPPSKWLENQIID